MNIETKDPEFTNLPVEKIQGNIVCLPMCNEEGGVMAYAPFSLHPVEITGGAQGVAVLSATNASSTGFRLNGKNTEIGSTVRLGGDTKAEQAIEWTLSQVDAKFPNRELGSKELFAILKSAP